MGINRHPPAETFPGLETVCREVPRSDYSGIAGSGAAVAGDGFYRWGGSWKPSELSAPSFWPLVSAFSFRVDAMRRFKRLNLVNDDIPVKVVRDGR